MSKNISQDKLDAEILFFGLSKYMADEKIKDKVDLMDEATLKEIDDVDKIIWDYLRQKKYSIRYVEKHDIVWIFKSKKLLFALPSEKYVSNEPVTVFDEARIRSN